MECGRADQVEYPKIREAGYSSYIAPGLPRFGADRQYTHGNLHNIGRGMADELLPIRHRTRPKQV
jgi:hypothetical protein